MKSIISITLHSRPWYTREVLDQWTRVRGVRDWYWAFHIDCLDRDLDTLGFTSHQEEAIENFTRRLGNIDHVVVMNQPKLGVSRNPLVALTLAFKEADRVILTEEDVFPSTDALEYLDWALSTRVRERVIAACAHSDKGVLPDHPGWHLEQWFTPWLWGTTREQWGLIEETWDQDYSTADSRGPAGWDCNLGLRVMPDSDLYAVFPNASRSKHIGEFFGVHSTPGQLAPTPSFVAERPKWNAPC